MMHFVNKKIMMIIDLQNIPISRRENPSMDRLIEQIKNRIKHSKIDTEALEMSPHFHLRLVNELVESGQDMTINANTTLLGLPIIFIDGDKDHCELLNNTQYNLRSTYNETLKKYQATYERSQLYINKAYKINNHEQIHQKLLGELAVLVARLDNLNSQIKQYCSI